MKWWEIPQNCECLFAIDYDSIVQSEGSFISFSNPSTNSITTQSSIKNRITKKHSFGSESDLNMINKPEVKLYKALKIDDVNLIFKTPINTGENCTWFLKCVVKGNTVLSQGSSTSTHGLTMDPFGTSEEYAKAWYTNNLLSNNPKIPNVKRGINTNTLHNVVVRNSTINQEVTLKTDYYSNSIPVASNYFSSLFGSTHDVYKLGYDSSTWYPKVEIIAYGLFNKILSAEEESLMWAAIDSQFAVSQNTIEFQTNLNYFEVLKHLDNTSFYFKDYTVGNILKVQEPQEDFKILKNSIKNKLKVKQKLYNTFEHIEDVVLEEGLPVSIKLYLYERKTGVLIKTTISDKKGIFTFNNLNKDLEYIVTANDSKYQFQSVIKNYNN